MDQSAQSEAAHMHLETGSDDLSSAAHHRFGKESSDRLSLAVRFLYKPLDLSKNKAEILNSSGTFLGKI